MRSAVLLLAPLIFLGPGLLLADPATDLLLPDQWYEFSFFEPGTPAHGCFPADPADDALDCEPSSGDNSEFAPAPSWDFLITQPSATLIVTDAFLHGDSFDVFDGGAMIFSTPAVAADGDGCGDDPDDCLLDDDASHAEFVIGPGAHFITITPNATADAGAAYFEVTEAPEPALWPALLLAIAGCFAARKQLRRA